MSLSNAPLENPDTTATPGPVVAGPPKDNFHAHFDCFSGAAGDMLLASCLDASGDPDHLRDHVTRCLAMGMPALADDFQIRTKKVWRGGMGSIAGMHVTVVSKYKDKAAPVPKRKVDDENDNDDDHQDHNHHNHDHEHGHEHRHEHQHEHQHDHQHGHQHEHQHGHHHHSSSAVLKKGEAKPSNNTNDDENPDSESHSRAHNHQHTHSHSHSHSHNHSSSSHSHSDGPLRNLPEIKTLLEESDDAFIAPWVKSMAIATFTELAKAEATTHGAAGIEDVHFHEVGAVDSIVDTVGTLIALHYLRATSFSCSRIPIGEGSVWTDHGILPVPAPATLRLLVGMPVCPGPMGVVTGELVTPTGAALLRALCLVGIGGGEATTKKLTGRPPNFTIRKIGIGAGSKDFEKHPNIVRLLIGDDVVTK